MKPLAFLSEPQRARVDLRLGRGVRLRARVEATPAGLLATGGLVGTILVATARIVTAARTPGIREGDRSAPRRYIAQHGENQDQEGAHR